MVIRDACEKRGYEFKLSSTEYGIKNCFLTYFQLIKELKANKYDGIAFYSIAQLPPQKKDRKKLYELILKKKDSFILFRKHTYQTQKRYE